MLKENLKLFLLRSNTMFKIMTVVGLIVVILSSISLYNQTYSLDVLDFTKSKETILYDIQRLNQNNVRTLNLLDSFPSNNSKINEFDLFKSPMQRKASLLTVVYDVIPEVNENFGTITIERLNRVLPIIQGSNDKQLNKGVGHVLSSVLPGENDNLVLAGHRETTFRNLDELILTDQILIQTSLGDFAYEVDNIRIVEADDETVIVSTGYASLTLITCYPFDWIGSAPQRYIVTGILVHSSLR